MRIPFFSRRPRPRGVSDVDYLRLFVRPADVAFASVSGDLAAREWFATGHVESNPYAEDPLLCSVWVEAEYATRRALCLAHRPGQPIVPPEGW